MKAYVLVVTCGALGAIAALEACADTDQEGGAPASPNIIQEASTDAAADNLAPDADTKPCADCEHFPVDCAEDRLCPNGPFDPNDPASLDPRTRVNAIAGRSNGDVWLAGASGAIAHFDGTGWTVSDPASDSSMRGIWLRGSAEILFTSLSTIHTRGLSLPGSEPDGGAPSPGGWTLRTISTSESPWGMGTFSSSWAAPGAEWIWLTTRTVSAGGKGLWRVHLDEGAQQFELVNGAPAGCSKMPCSSLTSIHGTSADDLWAVGAFGAAVHITDADGAYPTLKGFNTKTWNALNAVWAAAPNDVWAVGEGGVIRHYTGDSLVWETVQDVPTSESLNAIGGASPSDIWAVGDKGVALHYDGKKWTRVSIGGLEKSRRPELTSVWMPSPNHVWIGGQGILLSLGGKP